MSADGEIEVAVKAEGVDEAAADLSSGGGDGDGGGLASAATGGGGKGGLSSSLKKGGLIAGIAALVKPIVKMLEPIVEILNAFLAPIAALFLRLMQPVLRVLIKLLPVWFDFMSMLIQAVPTFEEGLQNIKGIIRWVKRLPKRIENRVKGYLAGIQEDITNAGTLLHAIFQDKLDGVQTYLANLPGRIWSKTKQLADMIGEDLAALPGQIATQLKNKLPSFASGGVVNSPTLATVGENGSEAIIPLDRLESMLQGMGRDRDPTPVVIQGGLSTLVEQIDRDPNVDL